MAQSEGRTLRRAPKILSARLVLFFVVLCSCLVVGLALHGLRAAAESVLSTSASSVQTNLGNKTVQDDAQQASQLSGKVPACTPAKYHLPTAIELGGLPDGLTTIQDSTQRYAVYGSSAAERLQQLQQCAPDGEYAGAASYQITWQYGYQLRADGLCEIVHPKIGLHLAMIVPEWLPTNTVPESAKTLWQDYLNALLTHERGHYAISEQYANRMMQQLQAVPPQACDALKTKADALLQGGMAQLQIAQDNYDATTDHGATQGANL